jgi:hypothetical protein
MSAESVFLGGIGAMVFACLAKLHAMGTPRCATDGLNDGKGSSKSARGGTRTRTAVEPRDFKRDMSGVAT